MIKVKVFLVLLFVFSIATLGLIRMAYISKLQADLNTLNRDVHTLTKTKDSIVINLESQSTLRNVEVIARGKLGMDYPSVEQKVQLEVD